MLVTRLIITRYRVNGLGHFSRKPAHNGLSASSILHLDGVCVMLTWLKFAFIATVRYSMFVWNVVHSSMFYMIPFPAMIPEIPLNIMFRQTPSYLANDYRHPCSSQK